MADNAQTSQPHLLRGVGRWSLVGLVINGVIGAGIFGLPAKIFDLTGTYSLLAFVVCGLFVALLLLCFAEVASRFVTTGGPYLYAHSAFTRVVAFEIGWLMWLTRLTGFAALCNLLVDYFGYFVPASGSAVGRPIFLTAIVGALTLVNFVGIRPTAIVSNLFTIGKLIPLILFVATGLFFLEPANFAAAPPPDVSTFSTGVLLLVFAFSGFEVALIPAGEVRDPKRDMPFALLTAIGITIVMYVLIQLVCIGTLPALAHSHRPLADAAARYLGSVGASVITAGALISITGTLNTGMLASPRLLYAMAENGQLPRTFAAVHPRYHTPHVAILVTAAIMLAFCLSTTFISALTISTVIRLITYGATCVSLIVLRRRDGRAPSFAVPGGTWVALAATAFCGWLLVNSTLREASLVGAAAAIGVVIYFLFRGNSPVTSLNQAEARDRPKPS